MLLVSGKDTPAQIAAAKTTFDPIASDFVPAFHEATDDLGTLELIVPPLPDGGIGGGGGAGGNGAGGNANGGGGAQASTGSSAPKSTSPAAEPSSGCGCRVADAGEIIEFEPCQRLVLKWRNEFRPDLREEGFSRMTYELEQVGESVKLTLVHEMDKPG